MFLLYSSSEQVFYQAYARLKVITRADVVALQAAPGRIIQSILRAHGGLKDDTSLVVIDVMPQGKNFPDCSASSGGGGGCFCT